MTFNFKSFYETSTSFTSNSIHVFSAGGSFNPLNTIPDILDTEVDSGHYASSVCEARLGLSLPPPDLRPLNRRASHAGNLGEVRAEAGDRHREPDFLSVPRQRTRGSSLPDNISSEEIYRLRCVTRKQCAAQHLCVFFWFVEPTQLTLFLSQKLLYVGKESNQQRRFFQIQKQ